MTNPIPDEFILKALAVHREMYPSRFPPGRSPAIADNIEPIARALIAQHNAALEDAAKWHEDRVKHWRKELDERRSWGGPTIGAQECINAIEHHAPSATAIRNMKVKADE